MSTRSCIIIETEKDGKDFLVGAYCHWDGYLSHNGKILLERYNSKEKAQKLVLGSGGYISSLDDEIITINQTTYTSPDWAGFVVSSYYDIPKNVFDYYYTFSNFFNSWHYSDDGEKWKPLTINAIINEIKSNN